MPRILGLLILSLLPMLAQAAGDPKLQIEYAGLDRSYLLHLPDPLPNNPLPLVVVLHGGGGSAESAASRGSSWCTRRVLIADTPS